MPKRKTQKPKPVAPRQDCPDCETPIQPRRSIPVAEVEEIVKREVNHVKAGRTIYDARSTILERLEDNEAEMKYLEGRLHQLQLDDKSIRSELKQINLSITRQLELDEA